MKRFNQLFLILCLCVFRFSHCLSQDISFYSQADVDTFNSSITSIDGSLIIKTNSDLDPIVDLSPLISITYIEYDLDIIFNTALTNLDGLENLVTIGGGLDIRENNALTNVDGLANLTSVGLGLQITDNFALTNIDGLANLTSVGIINGTIIAGSLEIFYNTSLSDCCAIQDLISTPNAIGVWTLINSNASGCLSPEEITSQACTSMKVSTNLPCIGLDNGSIQIQIKRGTTPYSYTWERLEDGYTETGNSTEANFIFENLIGGTYNLTVTDAIGTELIEENIDLIPIQGSIFEVTELTTTNSSNSLNNGAIHLTIAGGTPPYNLSWSGQSTGLQSNLADAMFTVPMLSQGEYEITVSDAIGNVQTISVYLLDETVPIFSCTEPLDIVILNDVSGSVDIVEYEESKQFFVDFLNAVNIGTGIEESRAAIIEWSSNSEQNIQILMTGNEQQLQNYINNSRVFEGNTNPHEALTFGENYLSGVARPNVERVLVLSTDGEGDQISPSLIALADQYKAAGYHIITIAFDAAYSNIYTRTILQSVASLPLLAPGAPAYSQLDADLAENIVNLYLCPVDPGSSATAYFNRDGAIDIIDIETDGSCPISESIDITFSIEALRELSIPAGTPVTFYYNNPALFSASAILTWLVPCAIPVGTIDVFTVNLPVAGAANIFAALNDDGNQSPPISFPITNIDELAYSNNISDTTTCIEAIPTLQAFKYTTTPIPICNNIVIYTVDVCNISDVDANDVIIIDNAPFNSFVLLNSVVNDNGCTINNNGSFDIPANCCVSITYTYDATDAANGNYNDQNATLTGPTNQIYINFDGATSALEDVTIDGTLDCPSTIIEFSKAVNTTDLCEDAFVVYTFTIDNQLNIPLQGLLLTDILPDPVSWVFQPYNLDGLKISNSTIVDNNATFIIDEVAANTVASFSMDAALGNWTADGVLNNTATLYNVPNLEAGGIDTLISNTVTTNVFAEPEIEVIQENDCNNTIHLSAVFNTGDNTNWTWITTGDGAFSENQTASTSYTLGNEDITNSETLLSVEGNSTCGYINETIEVLLDIPDPTLLTLETCEGTTIDYNETSLNIGDNEIFTLTNSLGCDSIISVTVLGLSSNFEELILESCDGISVDYNGTVLEVGESQAFTFTNSLGCDSVISVSVLDSNSSYEELTMNSCDGVSVDYNGTILEVGESQAFTFTNTLGCDSVVMVTVLGSSSSYEEIIIETCEEAPINYNGTLLAIDSEETFVFTNTQGCDSIVMVTVKGIGFRGASSMPNAFSPNGDGINDCLYPFIPANVFIQSYKLSIFNRWGSLMFRTTEPYDCWDGTLNDKAVNTGVYVWQLEIKTDNCEQTTIYSGDVTVMK